MAYYDPKTGEIIGCIPGSYTYAHELRHKWQHEKGILERVDRLHVFCYYLSFVMGAVGFIFLHWLGFFFGIGIAMSPYILASFLLELDAYIMGYLNWRRNDEKN